jgi:hypothetical protein
MKYRLGDITIKNWNSWDRVPRVDVLVASLFPTLTSGTFAYAVAYAGVYLGVTAVTSWALRALSPKPDFGAGSRGLLANSREATAPHQIVYGEVRKGGTVTFIESTGTTNQYLHQIIVLAGHEVNDIGDIYINDEVVTLDGSGFVTDTKWKDGDGNSKIRIKIKTGADNQTADSDLVSETSVTSDFKGEGIAYLYVRMEYDQNVFAEGIPLFTAKVQGKKVYDPRTSTTGYSANAALCIRDYLVSTYGLDNDGDTNDTSFQAAANTCDESVTLADASTENRYEINGVISLDQTPSDILGDMMTACAGTLFWGQGEWHLKVGEYTSSVKTFTLDDLRGPITLDTKHSRRDNFNIVRGTFTDAAQSWIRADYPEIRSSTFISNDNDIESAIDLALPFTTSSAMAQRLAKMTLFRAREQMTFTADFGLEAFEVECGDIIALTIDRYGWSAKEFEVVGWKFKNDGDAGDLRVALTLRETSSAAFSWSAEEAEITANNSTLPSATNNIEPSSVTVTDTGVVQTDGTFVAQIKVSWTSGTNKFLDHHEVQWKLTSASDYSSAQIDAGENSIILGPFEAGEQYNIRVRGVLSTGRKSAFVNAGAHTVGGDTIAPSPISGLSATGGIESVTLDWTAPTTQVGGGTLYDLKGYNVYRNTSNSQPASPVAFVSADKYVDGALTATTTYYYWITALDHTDNESTAVASGSVTTSAPPQDGADGADGADGINGTNGTNGTDGADGATGDTVVTGKVYYQTLQSSAPSTPSASSYSVSTASFTGLSSGWSLSQPSVDITDTSIQEWSSDFTVTIDGTTSAQTIVFTSPSGAIQVTTDLESDNYVAGTSGWHIERDTGNAEFQNATIRGTLNASDISAGTISVARLPNTVRQASGTTSFTINDSGTISFSSNTVSLTGVTSGNKILVSTTINVQYGSVICALNPYEAGFSVTMPSAGLTASSSATGTTTYTYAGTATGSTVTIGLGVIPAGNATTPNRTYTITHSILEFIT